MICSRGEEELDILWISSPYSCFTPKAPRYQSLVKIQLSKWNRRGHRGAFICTLIKLNWVNILIYTQGCICLSIRGSVVVSLGWLSRSKIEILGIFRSLTKEEALPLNDSLILSYPLLPKFSMQHSSLPSFIYLIRLAKLASLRDVKTFFCRVTSRLLKSELQFSSLHFISAFRNPTDTDFEINHGWECRNHLVSFIQGISTFRSAVESFHLCHTPLGL